MKGSLLFILVILFAGISKTSAIAPSGCPIFSIQVIDSGVTCYGSADGVIKVSASDGNGPYQYALGNSAWQSSPDFYDLISSSYTVYVIDNNGCTDSMITIIHQPGPLVVSPVDSISPTCPDGNNGSFVVIAAGGTPGYMYSDNGGPFHHNPAFTGQVAGEHYVTVRDTNGCTAFFTISVPGPPVTSTFDTAVTPVSCHGWSDGAIWTIITGTDTPYRYAWSYQSDSSPDLSGIPAGSYAVTITDGSGCRVPGPDSIIVHQPQALSYINLVTPVTCYGDNNGCITVNPSGGVQPYTHSWSDGDQTNTPCGLSIGSYTDTITDHNGCEALDSNIIIYQPTQVYTTIKQAGQNLIAVDTGGTQPYSYSWSNGSIIDTIYNALAERYNLTVTDHNGCMDTASFTILSVENINAGVVRFEAGPNPSAGLFNVTVQMLRAADVTISITDLAGRKISDNMMSNVQNTTVTIDMTDVAKGTYIIKLWSCEGSTNKKIIIE